MDSLDSDYCSNESEGNFHHFNRTPTPPKKLLQQQHFDNNKALISDNHLVFLVGRNEERVEIHNKDKEILLSKVPALRTQLVEHGVVRNGNLTELKMLNWGPHDLQIFLNYIRNGDVTSGEISGSIGLLRLCIEYDLQKLLEYVVPLAKHNITLDNCVQVYTLSIVNDVDELRVAAYNFLLRTGHAFVEHPSFLDLDCVTLSLLISSDDFSVIEIALFKRLKEWVVRQCKRLGYPPDRKEFFGRVAGLLFTHVRYAQMTPKEFRTEVLGSGLLNESDIEAIQLRHRTHPGLWYTLPPSKFVDRPRMNKLQFAVPLYNNVQIGFRKIAGAKSTIQESVRFLVSHDIYLTSIGFFGPAKSDQTANGSPSTCYNIKIHVEGDYTKHHFRCPVQNAVVTTKENYTIDLSHPFHIQRLQPYKLTVWIDGEATQFGVFPLPQAIVLIQDRGELITFHFSDADTDPVPSLETSGPSSFSPILSRQQPNFQRYPFKQEPRMSGVIRCISFVLKN